MTEVARQEADVIVVGGGGSGLAAAIEAARLGRSVILLEKNPRLGGTTGRSVGSITSSCTSFQAEEAFAHTPHQPFEDMPLFAHAVGLDHRSRNAITRVVDQHVEPAEMVHRLSQHGANALAIRDVGLQGNGCIACLARDGLGRLARLVGDDDVGPFLREKKAGRPPDARSAPGDDTDLVRKTHSFSP